MQAALKASMSSSPCARIWPSMRMPSRLLALPEICFQAFEPPAPKPSPSPRLQPERIRKREAARQKTLQEQKERA